MIYLTIFFLCTACLFLILLEDRYRIWITLAATGGAYLLAIAAAFALGGSGNGPEGYQLPVGAGCLVFFVMSAFVFENNLLQKFFLALLCWVSYSYLGLFIPLVLGVLPFSAAGPSAGLFSLLLSLLFMLVTGLCLYRPLRHFRDRGASGFLIGMSLLLFCIRALCLGHLDFLFRSYLHAGRLFFATLLYILMIFCFRSIYQAGRFREKVSRETARDRILEMERSRLEAIAASVREARTAEKAGEYALDTVSVMLADGYAEKVNDYIPLAKKNAAANPLLDQYHEDPYMNALIASKASFAARNNIAFECNVVFGGSSLKDAEVYLIADEMLTRACGDAAGYQGQRKVRFTVFPTGRSLRFEAVYSADPPRREKLSLREMGMKDLLQRLFDDDSHSRSELRGLENAEEIVARYSGRLTVSGSPGEVILLLDTRG